MPALPAQRVEMIPVDRVTIVNPRVRNQRNFREIVDNIAKIGLKKPITVTRRAEAGGPFYDLVCGQGRLEAYIELGQSEVPALVVTADPEEARTVHISIQFRLVATQALQRLGLSLQLEG